MRGVTGNFKQACLNGKVENQLKIEVLKDDSTAVAYTITNAEIVSESMKFHQSICDDSEFKFGGCIAGQFEIEIAKNIDLTGKDIQVNLGQSAAVPTYPGAKTFPGVTDSIAVYPGFTVYKGEEFVLFYGKVYSCKLNKNRITRKLVAYDDFYMERFD